MLKSNLLLITDDVLWIYFILFAYFHLRHHVMTTEARVVHLLQRQDLILIMVPL